MEAEIPVSPKVHFVSPYALNPVPSPSGGGTPRVKGVIVTTTKDQRAKSADTRAKARKLMREKAALIQKPKEVAAPYTRKLASPYTIVTTIKTEDSPRDGDKVKMGWMVSHQLINLLGPAGSSAPGTVWIYSIPSLDKMLLICGDLKLCRISNCLFIRNIQY